MSGRRLVPAVLAAVLVSAPARDELIGSFPLLVRMEAYVETKPEGVHTLDRWVAAVRDRQIVLHLTQLRVLNADVAWWNIESALQPPPVTFTVYGDQPTLARLSGAPPGERLIITGVLQLGPGPVTLLLRDIEAAPAATASPAATPTREAK
jgi:hypothetical protein